MTRKIFLTEDPEKLLPSDASSVLKDSAERRVPPSIGIILKSESSKVYLLFLGASDGSKDLLHGTNPCLSHIWVALPLKGRRTQPAKPIQHRFTIATVWFRGSLMVYSTRIAILSLERSKHLPFHLHPVHQPPQ